MKTWIILIIFLMITTATIADQGEIEVYKPKEVLDLSIHLTNLTGDVSGATCQAQIRNDTYDVIETITLNEINGGWYNGTYNTSRIGKYFCRQNCTKGTFFVAETCDFVIQGEKQMPIAIIITAISVIIIYFLILAKLFTERQFTEHGLIKLLFFMVAFWIILLPLNMAIEFNEFNGGPQDVTDNLNVMYQLMVYLNYFVTIYFTLWFIIQIFKKLMSTITNK